MTKQATTMKRMMALMALAMAAVLALSMLDASDAEAKKRKKRPPAFNVVVCAADPCNGTSANDYLVGTNEGSESIFGGEGNDTYTTAKADTTIGGI